VGTNKEALSSLPRPVLPSDIVASHLLEVRFQVSARWRYLGLLGGLRGRWWASISLSSSRRRCSASWRSRVARVTCSCVVEQLSERQSPRRRCFCRWRCLLLARHLLRSFKKKNFSDLVNRGKDLPAVVASARAVGAGLDESGAAPAW
jgi:hypothetical protein